MSTARFDAFGGLQGSDFLALTPTSASAGFFSARTDFALERGIQALNVRLQYSGVTILFEETIRANLQFWYDGPAIGSDSLVVAGMTYRGGADLTLWARTVTFNFDEVSNLEMEFSNVGFSPVNRLMFTGVTNGFGFRSPQRIGIQFFGQQQSSISPHTRFAIQLAVSQIKNP